eukprot:1462591-Pyramimonas_sp.AAC.1
MAVFGKTSIDLVKDVRNMEPDTLPPFQVSRGLQNFLSEMGYLRFRFEIFANAITKHSWVRLLRPARCSPVGCLLQLNLTRVLPLQQKTPQNPVSKRSTTDATNPTVVERLFNRGLLASYRIVLSTRPNQLDCTVQRFRVMGFITSVDPHSELAVSASGVEWGSTNYNDASSILVHHDSLLRNKRNLLAYL